MADVKKSWCGHKTAPLFPDEPYERACQLPLSFSDLFASRQKNKTRSAMSSAAVKINNDGHFRVTTRAG